MWAINHVGDSADILKNWWYIGPKALMPMQNSIKVKKKN